jgi:hypothetical protein
MPDFRGCDNKIREKSAQLSGELGVIVVDVTGIAGGDADWRAHTLALFGDAAHRHVRAVVLTNVVCESAGTRRQVVVVHNSAATGEPSDSTLERIFAVENWR